MDTEELEQSGEEQVDTEEKESARPADADAAEPQEGTSTPVESDSVEVELQPEAVEIRRLEEERDQYKNALIQERADFENYKKSHAALAASSFDNGVGTAAAAMLPILDNFERALATECSDQAFADGMNMIMRQMRDALQGLGLEEVDTSGEFDPNCHHAVMQSEDPTLGSNVISETLQKGYNLKGKLLRPAMVKVNK